MRGRGRPAAPPEDAEYAARAARPLVLVGFLAEREVVLALAARARRLEDAHQHERARGERRERPVVADHVARHPAVGANCVVERDDVAVEREERDARLARRGERRRHERVEAAEAPGDAAGCVAPLPARGEDRDQPGQQASAPLRARGLDELEASEAPESLRLARELPPRPAGSALEDRGPPPG